MLRELVSEMAARAQRAYRNLALAALALCSCRADPAPQLNAAASSLPQPTLDAGRLENLLRQKRVPPGPLSEVRFDAGAAAREDEQPWREARSFRLSFSAGLCLGTCPAFKVTVDQRGHVHFRGTRYVARPGSYDIVLTDTAARQLYDDVIASGFLQFRDRYESEQDGCEILVTDQPAYAITLEAADRMKRVTYNPGCLGDLPELSTLDALIEHIPAALPIAELIGPRPLPRCEADEPELTRDFTGYEASYVLHDTGAAPLGILRVSRDSNETPGMWQLEDCTGNGIVGAEVSRFARLPACNAPLMTSEDRLFPWVGVDYPVSVVLLDVAPAHTITLRVITLDSVVVQHGVAGAACAPR